MITIPTQPIIITIDESSKVGEARRTASALAHSLGFDETETGKVALIATEATTNLLKHAGGGELFLSVLEREEQYGLEILALDRGPGMTNIERCMEDGFSTAGSSGNGLGALARLATDFDIHSSPGGGTVLMARFWNSTPSDPGNTSLDYGVIACPAIGEEICGDSWAVASERKSALRLAMVVDGLGHGPQAAEASRKAVAVFHDQLRLGPVGILHAAHAALKSTRGAAMAIAQIDGERGEVRFAGVGNIGGTINVSGERRGFGMVSQNGIVGHAMRKVQEYTYPWSRDDLLIMYSDGLGSQWDLERYAGISARRPSLTAGLLYRDYKRGRDDVTVLVAREPSVSPP